MGNAVFLHLTTLVVVVMMVVMAVLFFLVIVVMVVMLMMMVMMFVSVLIVVVVIIIVFNDSAFHLFNPCGRSGHFVEVKHVGVKDHVEVYLAVVAGDDFGGGLQGTNDTLHTTQFLRRHF